MIEGNKVGVQIGHTKESMKVMCEYILLIMREPADHAVKMKALEILNRSIDQPTHSNFSNVHFDMSDRTSPPIFTEKERGASEI